VAKDEPSLLAAARAFPKEQHIPRLGWSALSVTVSTNQGSLNPRGASL
jgi:hypothetical protein